LSDTLNKFNHKNITFGFILYALFSIFSVALHARETEKTLSIAIMNNYPPFTIIGPNGQPFGLYVDMWNLWSEATGIPVQFHASSWVDTVEAVKNGSIDIHSGLNKNAERGQFLEFSDPIHIARSALYFPNGDTQPVPLEDLDGTKVGIIKGSFQENFLKEKYPNIIRVLFDDGAQMTAALLGGDVRAVLDETISLQASLARLGLNGVFQRGHETILTNLVHAGVQKGRADLIEKINAGFKAIPRPKLVEVERRWLPDAFDHYYANRGNDLRLTPQEQAWLKTSPDIRIAVSTFINPVDIIDKQGQYSGMNADLLEVLSKRIGVTIKPEFFGSWSEVVESTLSGKVSGALSFSITPEREKHVLYTKPYAYDPVVIISTADRSDISSRESLSGKKVSVIKGLAFLDEVKSDVKDGSIVLVNNEEEALDKLAAGEIDAHVTTLIFYGNQQKKKYVDGLKVAGSRNTEGGSLRIAIHKSQPLLYGILDKALNSLTQDELAKLRDKWLTPNNKPQKSNLLTTEEFQWLRQNPITRISVMKNWPPYDQTDSQGRHYGLHSDLLQLLNKHLGTNFVVMPYEEWKDVYDTAASGANDGILGLSWTKKREETFLFSSAYHYKPADVVMRADVPAINEWSGLNGKKILMPAKASLIEKVKAELPEAIVIETFSKDDAMSRLAKGEGDAYVAWISASAEKLKSLGLTITAQVDDRQGEFTLGVPVSKPLVASIVQKGINSITQAEWASLKERWFSTNDRTAKSESAVVLTQDEKNWLKNHNKIRIGNTMDWPPFDFTENDLPKGLSIDIVNLIAQKTGVNVEFINGYKWSELLERFNKEEIDVLPALYWSEERAKTFNFTEAYAQNFSILAVHNDHKNLNSLSALKGRKVGVIEGFATVDLLKKEYPEIELVTVDNALKGLQLVSLGTIDAYFDSIGVISYVLDNNMVPNISLSLDPGLKKHNQTQLRMATLQSNTILRNILQKGLDSISPEEMRNLKNRWLPLGSSASSVSESRVKFSDEEKAFIASKPKLTLGIDKAWAPFEFVEDGVYSGISSDVIKKISELSGLALTPKLEGTWDDVLTGAKNGTIDILPMLEATKERQEFLDFSESYVSYPIVIMTRDDAPFISNLGGIGTLKTGVVSGYSIESDLMKDYPNIERIPQKDFESMLLNLSSGKIDVALSNLGVATYMIGKLNLNNLKVAAPTEYTNDLAMGIPKGNPILHSIIQKSLDAISEDEMTSIKNRWVALQVQFGLDFKTVAIYALPLLGGFIIIIGFIIMWNRKLGREVAERHEAEKQSRMLLEAVGEGIFGVDQKGYVTFINSVASQCLGFTSEQLIGQKVHALIHHTRPDGSHFPVEECPMWEAYTNGKISRIDNEVLWRQDGTSFPVEYNATPLRRNDEIVGAVISFRDITDVKEATKALHDHLGELERFNELAVDRELRMIELKQEINGLLKERGAEEKYEIVQ
jgi:PAS domain S-box-containing protein